MMISILVELFFKKLFFSQKYCPLQIWALKTCFKDVKLFKQDISKTIIARSFKLVIDIPKCHREEITASLNDFSNRWCKRENVEPDALKEQKINIFKIIDIRISFCSVILIF